MPRPTPRLAPVPPATRPWRPAASRVIVASLRRQGPGRPGPRPLAMQRRLLLRRRERPRGLRPALLAEREAQLARRGAGVGGARAVGVVRAERRARLVEIERTEEVALEVAVLARHLLRGSTNRRHFPTPTSPSTPSLVERRHPTIRRDGLQRPTPQMPQISRGIVKRPANHGIRPGP